MKEGLIYFDSFACVGKRGIKDPLAPWSTEDLLAEMEHCGIHGALVTHGSSLRYAPMPGNLALVEETRGHLRLFECWTLLPSVAGDFPEPAALLEQMKKHGVRAAKLHPKSHQFRPDRRTCGTLLEALAKGGIPLLMEAPEIEWEDVASICERHPSLPVLLQKAGWRDQRFLLPLFGEFKNLHLELSNLQANAVVERMTDRFGPDRLLFGTGAPVQSPGAAKALLDYAEIPFEAKRKIAGENLARLVGLELPPEYPPTERGRDRILDAVRAVEPLRGFPVVDAHAHLVPHGVHSVAMTPLLRGDVDAMMYLYDRIGVSEAVIAGSWAGLFTDSQRGNDEVTKAIADYPNRVVGCVTIDPNYVKDVAAEAEKQHSRPRMWGMKPYHPGSGIPYDDPVYAPWFEYGNQRKLFALLHTSGPEFPRQIRMLSEKYPDLSILLAHSAGAFAEARAYADVAKECPNVFLEITLTPVPLGTLEYLVREVGADRVLFGTDTPMRDPRPQFGWLAYAHLTETEKRKIFGANMTSILERVRK